MADLAKTISKEKIQELQNAMLDVRCDMPESKHYFAPGMYCREFSMPAGMLVVGKTHKYAHFIMMVKGRAELITENGREIVEAGYIGVGTPGVKRVALALEDCTFVNVHLNESNTRDLKELEEFHIVDEGFKIDYHKATQEYLK